MKKEKENRSEGSSKNGIVRQLSKTLVISLTVIFTALTCSVAIIMSLNLFSAIEGQFRSRSDNTKNIVSNIINSAEMVGIDISAYIENAYELGGQGAINMSGDKKGDVNGGRTYHSMIFKDKEITELNADVEKYIVQIAEIAAINNDEVSGVGLLFEPYAYDKNIESYAFYVSNKLGSGEVEPYGSDYETYSKEIFYQEALEAKAPIITEPYEAEDTTIISYVKPILYKNEVQGVILVDIEVSVFDQIAKNSDASYTSMYYTVFNENKTFVYDSEDPDKIGMNYRERVTDDDEWNMIVENMEKGDYFKYDNRRTDGNIWTKYYVPISVNGRTWWAVSSIMAKEKEEPIRMTLLVVVVLALLSLVLLNILIVRIIKKRVNPIKYLVDASKAIAQGNFEIEIPVNSKDEIGILAEEFRYTMKNMKRVIQDANSLLSEMAEGNFAISTSCEDAYVGEFEGLIASMRKLNRQLSQTLQNINEASDQVALGAEQLSEGAQSLAEGATDQAGAVEELQATITNVTEMVANSEQDAKEAYEKTTRIRKQANSSNDEMNMLVGAMNRVTEISQQVNSIISEIEDIASQTNLLSLNAAIEAARAGDAGRGFGVVADQIRKLAEDSAASAVNTRRLIENTISEIHNGNQITERTKISMEEVVVGVDDFAETVREISSRAADQTLSMREIEAGVEQISEVVQANSASAEETSATSEELSAQADTLKSQVEKFKFKK